MNPACGYRTFSERFDFIAPKERKTRRLVNKILKTSSQLGSVSASVLLKEGSIKVCKSSICDLLKKCRFLWIRPMLQRFVWMTLLSVRDILTEQ